MSKIIGNTVGTPFNPKNLGDRITEITEDTHIYDLADGIYYIRGTSGATIYYDDSDSEGVQDGLLWVNYSEDLGVHSFIAVGRDAAWYTGTFIGEVYNSSGRWVCEYYQPENSNNRAYAINDKTYNHKYYPSVKLMTDYVEEQLKNVGGGSNIDLVTEFEGTDVEYEEKQVYNANVVNAILSEIVGLLGDCATTEYVNKLIGGIENGSY